jgi:hypothetical protein
MEVDGGYIERKLRQRAISPLATIDHWGLTVVVVLTVSVWEQNTDD